MIEDKNNIIELAKNIKKSNENGGIHFLIALYLLSIPYLSASLYIFSFYDYFIIIVVTLVILRNVILGVKKAILKQELLFRLFTVFY